jgi:hypothetical protein
MAVVMMTMIPASIVREAHATKPEIRTGATPVAAIYKWRSIYHCRRWIINNSRRIIDNWWRRINCRRVVLG